jgi:CrcB protein
MTFDMSSSLLLIAVGGATGSVLRYLLSQAIPVPLGTLFVNVAGSFAIGIAFVILAGRGPWALFFVSGVLGGFTTFSAFSLDTIRLLADGRVGFALFYVLLSIVLSVLGCFLGISIARSLP